MDSSVLGIYLEMFSVYSQELIICKKDPLPGQSVSSFYFLRRVDVAFDHVTKLAVERKILWYNVYSPLRSWRNGEYDSEKTLMFPFYFWQDTTPVCDLSLALNLTLPLLDDYCFHFLVGIPCQHSSSSINEGYSPPGLLFMRDSLKKKTLGATIKSWMKIILCRPFKMWISIICHVLK